MILDVRYKSKAPEQLQGVRRHTVYFNSEDGIPEVVIHFKEFDKPTVWIAISELDHITVTND